MADEDKTDLNWRSRWAAGVKWATEHPKIARGALLAILLLVAFTLGRCTA